MEKKLTGADVMAAIETDVPPSDNESTAFASGISNAQSAINVELHALARNTSCSIRDVQVSAEDVERMISEVKGALEAHDMHKLPGLTGEGVRAARDHITEKLRSLLGETEKA